MFMKKNATTWLFVLDQRQARLLEGREVPGDRYHFDLRDALSNSQEEHEHGRPSPRSGKDGHSYASEGHENEELLHRYAGEVSSWLGKQLGAHRMDRAAVFAPARLLGALRKKLSGPAASRVQLAEGDFSYMGPGELAKHPAVLRTVAALLDREPFVSES